MASNKRFKAEQSASLYLQMRGFEVIELNFRRSRYSIDIIAKKTGQIFFVKLMLLSDQSRPYLGVAPSEMTQMRLAAASWIEEYEWQGDIHYSAVEIDEPSNAVISFMEDFN